MNRRLLRLLHEYLGDAVLILGCVAVVVTVVPSKDAVVANALASEHFQTMVETVSKLVTTSLTVIGAVLAYRKYFKGRTFSARVKLGLASSPVCRLDDGAALLHSVDFDVENIGTITIWEPEPRLRVSRWDSDVELGKKPHPDAIQSKLLPGGLSGIAPGEKCTYHYRLVIPASVEAFKINAELVSDGRQAWHRAITVANALEKAESDKGGGEEDEVGESQAEEPDLLDAESD